MKNSVLCFEHLIIEILIMNINGEITEVWPMSLGLEKKIEVKIINLGFIRKEIEYKVIKLG